MLQLEPCDQFSSVATFRAFLALAVQLCYGVMLDLPIY